MQKIGLPLTFLLVFTTTVVFAQKNVSEGSLVAGNGGVKSVLEGSAEMGKGGSTKVPLQVQGDSLILLPGGSEVLLSKQGFPQQIWIDSAGERVALLAENVHFHFINQVDGKDFRLKGGEMVIEKKGKHEVSWHATTLSDVIRMFVYGGVVDKGGIALSVRVTALEDVDLKDIVMHIPMEKEIAKSMQGLGRSGDYSFDSVYHWKWPGRKYSEHAWIGRGNNRLGFGLLIGKTWWNDGRGGIDVGIKGKSMLVNSYSGARHLKKGETIIYNFYLGI